MTENKSGWTIDGTEAPADEVARQFVDAEVRGLRWSVTVDGVEVRREVGPEESLAVMEGLPITASWSERLGYSVGALAAYLAVFVLGKSGTIADGWVTAAAIVVLVGMVMVNRRVGIGVLD